MTALATIAANHGGTLTHCPHSGTTYCRRCRPPLHCWIDRTSAVQFDNAVSVVAFAREYGRIMADATRAAWSK